MESFAGQWKHMLGRDATLQRQQNDKVSRPNEGLKTWLNPEIWPHANKNVTMSTENIINSFFVSLLCFIPGCCIKHPMAAPWHYHLFNLFYTPPPPPSSSSSPPPQPVAYLYPVDSKEPFKSLRTSSARDNSDHESDSTLSTWSPASSPFLHQLQIVKAEASTAGYPWESSGLWLHRTSED